jgi:hypothetical protein
LSAALAVGCASSAAPEVGPNAAEDSDAGGCASAVPPDAGAGDAASTTNAPIVVDTVKSETGPVKGECSLVMAVTALRRQADYGGCTNASGATSIVLPAGTFDISSGLELLASDAKTPPVSLVGQGVGRTILDTKGPVSPAVEIDGLTITVSQLTVRATKPAVPITGLRLDKSAIVTLDHVKVTGFTHTGVWNADATLTVQASTIDGNSSTGLGGGMYAAAQDATVSPTTFVNYSTISRNRASLGGGIYNLGYLNLMYSTIADNTATDGKGGGVYLGGDYIETAHCTIAFNSATASGLGGGIYIDPSIHANVHVQSSIIASNTGAAASPDYFGLVRDSLTKVYDPDLFGSAAGITTGKGKVDVVGNPSLGALADNGGPTETCAVLAKESLVVNAARDFSDRSKTDQRFLCAPYGGTPDIGAFEWRPVETSMRRRVLLVLASLMGVAVLFVGLSPVGRSRVRAAFTRSG